MGIQTIGEQGTVMAVSLILLCLLAFVLLMAVWPRFRSAVGPTAVVVVLLIWTCCRKLMRFLRLAKPVPKVRCMSSEAVATATRAIEQSVKKSNAAAAAA